MPLDATSVQQIAVAAICVVLLTLGVLTGRLL